MQGWISLHRKLLASDIFQNEKLLKVFIYCLLKASHKERKQIVGLQTVDLKPGQFIFGRRKAASELNMKESTVWKYMKFLESIGSLSLNSNNKFTVVNIVKWDNYQGEEREKEQQNNNKETTKEQQNNTNNNVNNGDNVNKKDIKTSRSKLKFETHHMKLAELLYREIKANNPSAKEPNLNSWANTFRLMMERPKEMRPGKEIQELILWTQNHSFWYKNILSADKLRKQYDRLLLEMRDESKSGGPKRLIATEKPAHIEDPTLPDDIDEQTQKLIDELYEGLEEE